jgi:hypothetical protein
LISIIILKSPEDFRFRKISNGIRKRGNIEGTTYNPEVSEWEGVRGGC